MRARWLLCVALLALPTSAPAAGKSAAASSKSSKSKKKKSAKKKPPAVKKTPPFPCGALPWQPILLTSRVVPDGATAVVTQELLLSGRTPDKLPKGAASEGRLFVSFGAPGLPRTMRIEFAALREGELAFPGHIEGRTRMLTYAQSPESDGACTVLGRDREAGVVIQVPADLAVDPTTQLGVLRIQQTVLLGTLPGGGHDLVLRLSNFNGKPVRMGPVQSKELPSLELCAHGQSVPVQGSPLYQATLPQQNLCVSFTK